MSRLLGTLWVLPCTLLGLALALAGGARFFGALRRGAVGARMYVARNGSPWNRWLARRGFGAITVGEVTIFRDISAACEPHLCAHELRHVEQYRRLGVLFFFAYPLCSALAWAMGRDAYRDQWMEQDATLSANEGRP